MAGFIAFLHVAGWGLLLLATRVQPAGTTATLGIGTGVLAYTLGMRHAFDADHIAAIDNTTRKLMAEGQRPLSVGFWFALGHSSVVFTLVVLLGVGVRALGSQLADDGSALHRYGGLVGTLVSGTFLLLIALLNAVVLAGILRVFSALRTGEYDEAELEQHLDSRGLLMRFFAPVARTIDRPWKMYPLGILFGVGFDTATEIAFLVLAGTSVAAGMPAWAILSLPLLFAAGMSLLDTIDGSFMNFAYGWAFSRPVRKVYYNITITGLSITVALVIGTLELAQVLATQLGLSGPVWDYAAAFDLNKAGFLIVGLFVAVWVAALAIWHFGRIEQRWQPVDLRRDAAEAAAGARPVPVDVE